MIKKKYSENLKDLTMLRLKIVRPLLILTIIPYFFFIGVIAFRPEIFSPLIVDTYISIGIFLGFFLIFLIFLITVLYVFLANKYIEPQINAIKNDT